MVVHDGAGNRFILTRHLPLDRDDVTPDKLWTEAECRDLLKVAMSDGHSIARRIDNLRQNSKALSELKKPDPGPSSG